MRITVLSGGVGGARFLTGLRDVVDSAADSITVIGNTADDIWLFGLRVCPDLDTVMYTLGQGIDLERGWGRRDETWLAKEELAAYGVEPSWFGLGDRDIATHLVRTQMLNAGFTLSAVTQALCARWKPGVDLLPMTDDRVETHVVIDDPEAAGGRRAVHFQEYWVRLHAPVAYDVRPVGADESHPAPGVIEAITEADVVILPPSNPVVSIGIILGVPGVRDALRGTRAPVVGVSPLVGGRPVRGHADVCLRTIGVDETSTAVAGLYSDFLDGWLVDEDDPMPDGGRLEVVRRPLLMSSVDAAAEMAGAALDLGLRLRAERAPA